MMIKQILLHTPAWVFALFFILIALGYQQSRSRYVRKNLAFLLPAGMITLSFLGVVTTFGGKPIPLALWGVGLVLFALLGSQYFPIQGSTYNQNERKYFIPGSWIPMLVIMAIYFTKYSVGILTGLQYSFIFHLHFIVITSFVYGCFSGYFAARSITLWRISNAS